MVAYLEKTERNAEFHEIIDFLAFPFIMLSLHITAKVAGKPVSISEASIRSDLLFDDANGIDSLPNQAIFYAIQLMGSKSTSWDQIPTNIVTAVICLTSNQKYNFSKLFFDVAQTDPSPRPSPSTILLDSIPKSSGGNLGGHSSSDKSLSGNEGECTPKLALILSLFMAWIAKCLLEAKDWQEEIIIQQWCHKESVSKQGRKFAKGEPSVHRDPLFDEIPEDTLDHMETENAQDVGRTRELVGKENENDENMLSTKDVLSTDKEKVSTDKEKVSTDRLIVSTDGSKVSTDSQRELRRSFQQLASDDEMARKIQEGGRKFPAQQRSEAIRNRPPTKNQLRNQMMTYLKHVGNFKHSELKTKKFKEIQALYEKIKRSDEDFISIGSAEDERLIKKMNEKGIDSSKNEMVKEESKEEVKEESKEEESNRKRKLGTRKKMKSRKRRFIQNTSEDDSEKENDELRLYLTIAPDEEKEVDYEILDRKYPIKEWKTKCLGTKPQVDKAEHLEEINQNVVIRSNGQKRYFSTLMRVLSIFDRDDLNVVYQLVMDRYQDEIPEGFDRDWNIVSWKLHGSSGVHTLMTEAGLVIHMLIEKKYPLRKKVLLQMLELKLESEEDSTMALELIRFVKKQVAELEPEDPNGDEEDL
ncbi:hypothetical protein Tco_0660865 [Tanacetum coccineum]